MGRNRPAAGRVEDTARMVAPHVGAPPPPPPPEVALVALAAEIGLPEHLVELLRAATLIFKVAAVQVVEQEELVL